MWMEAGHDGIKKKLSVKEKGGKRLTSPTNPKHINDRFHVLCNLPEILIATVRLTLVLSERTTEFFCVASVYGYYVTVDKVYDCHLFGTSWPQGLFSLLWETRRDGRVRVD